MSGETPEKPMLPPAGTEVPSGRERQLAALRSHAFTPGVSGNAGGRSKSDHAFAVGVRQRLPELSEALFGIALNNRAATVARVRAIEVLLERGLGKAPAHVVVETDLASLSDGELHRMIHTMLADHVRTIEGEASDAS